LAHRVFRLLYRISTKQENVLFFDCWFCLAIFRVVASLGGHMKSICSGALGTPMEFLDTLHLQQLVSYSDLVGKSSWVLSMETDVEKYGDCRSLIKPDISAAEESCQAAIGESTEKDVDSASLTSFESVASQQYFGSCGGLDISILLWSEMLPLNTYDDMLFLQGYEGLPPFFHDFLYVKKVASIWPWRFWFARSA
ncbi:hypothetical protein HAX54_024317, partial [Datura stramonium]|nr:hypothetical protein [Datura stramonium]